MDLRLEVFGVSSIETDLLHLQGRARDMRELLDNVGQEFLSINRATFASEGNGQWAPLSPSTVASRGGRAHPILDDDGELKAALTRQGAAGNVYDITSDSVTVGTDLLSARFAQGTGRSPRRAPVQVSGPDRARLIRSVQKHLEAGL